MDNNEKKIQENFRGGGGGGGRGGFSGGNMGMRGGNFSQGNIGMRRAGIVGAAALGGRHIYNKNHGWDHHRSNYYRPYFFGVPIWYWNNGSYNNDGGSYYDSYPDTVNYNFYDVREADDNNYS